MTSPSKTTRLTTRRKGVTLTGYGLIVGLISIVALSTVTAVGSSADELFGDVSGTLQTVNDGTASSGQGAGEATPEAPAAISACQAHRDAGETTDGTYQVDPDGSGGLAPFNVYCDMEGAEGWTLIARNTAAENSATTWEQDWTTYKAGFGGVATGTRVTGWLGLDKMHALTAGGVDLQVRQPGGSFVSDYTSFSINDESDNYRMFVTNGPGAVGDFESNHSGMQFTTFDRDNDTFGPDNCASSQGYRSAWWFAGCWSVIMHNSPSGTAHWGTARDIELWVR